MTSNRYRRTENDLAYGDLPPPSRWDTDRFQRESDYRRSGAPVIEQRPPYESARRTPAYYEDDIVYEHDRSSGPRGSRDRRYFEEDQYYDPRASAGAMVPFRAPERPPRPAAPARPAMLRRQSSVDRFDFERRRDERYREEYRPPAPPRPRESRGSHYDIKIYDDVKVQDPEYYGDDGFREYREREWTRSRTRNDSPSPNRRAPSIRAPTEIIDARFEEEKVVEKTYPRRGKTRMPKRLVHTKVLFDMGYPYYEEDEKTILIELALGPENIDEVFAKSKELRERETITTRLIEAPLASHKSVSEAPRSVREWDQLRERSVSPGSSISQSTRKSRRSKSQAMRRSSVHESIHRDEHLSQHGGGGPSIHESIHEAIHRDRSPSPARTARTARTGRSSRRTRSRAASRRSSSDRSGTTIVDREVYRRETVEESNPLDIGPLALVDNKPRSDAEIRDEIRRLEMERREIRRDSELIRYDDRRRVRRDSSPLGVLRSPSPVGEIVVADRRSDDFVAVRKDKRARSRSRPAPPSSGLLKAMMFTAT